MREEEGLYQEKTFINYEEAKQAKDVTAKEIRHFSHQHVLQLSDQIKDDEEEQYCCEACVLPIESSFYSCLECNFFLHKTCATLPEKKDYWNHRDLLILRSEGIFYCISCFYVCSGFAYCCEQDQCEQMYGSFRICLRCIAITDKVEVQAHQHSLVYIGNSSPCSAFGGKDCFSTYRCKACDYGLGRRCIIGPKTARHKDDKHLLTLTYHDDDEDPERWVCLICEEKRDPNHWFYNCWDCDFAAHPKCVLGNYPFIKRGTSYTIEDHPHPLTFQNGGNYVLCNVCGERCKDLILKCSEPECDYTIHWECKMV